MTGDGDDTSSFRVDDGALQWRMAWTCERGRLVVSAGTDELIDAACPAGGTAYATRAGSIRLEVRADGPWALEVDQQLDVPLVEPPLPAMTAADAVEVAAGDLYGIEQSATDEVVLYRLGDGSYALRLDDFFVTPNIDLEIHFSPRPEPRTSDEFVEAGSAIVAPLDITTGSLNFVVPPDVDPLDYESIVIWCPLIHTAYGGATIEWRT